MKTLRLIFIGLILSSIFVISASAQANAGKVVFVDPGAFSQTTGGITKYINALKIVNNEFRIPQQELNTMQTKINNLKVEIQNLSKANPAVPVNQKTFNDKRVEHDRLVRELKFKQEDLQAKYDVRLGVVMGPVNSDIGKALDTFGKQKGFAMILNISQMSRAGIVLAIDPKYDVTKEFIIYYNARPAGAAAATN